MSTATPTEPALVHLDAASFGYGATRVIQALDLTVTAGTWLGLVGANGCGKSTVLRGIAGSGILGGSVRVAGHSLAQERMAALRHLGVAVPVEVLPPLLTGQQALEVVALAHQLPEVSAQVLPLAETLDMTPHLPRQIRHYSFGMRQKLSVLLALASDPKVLLLDETFNGLDPASSLTLKRYLSRRVVEEGLAVILATHSLDIVERYCNTLLVLGEGGARGYWDGGAFAKLVASPGQLESALAAQSGGA